MESVLIGATLNAGTNFAANTVSLVEECECPMGYTGRSCENCAFGYARVYENNTAHERIGKCIKCECNGHVAECDLVLDKCGECLHNTYGDR